MELLRIASIVLYVTILGRLSANHNQSVLRD